MDLTRRLEIELPEELADAVEAEVRSGRFASESEAIGAALTLLREQDAPLEEWLRTEVVEAYDEWKANPSGGLSLDEVSTYLDEARKRRQSA